MSDKVAHLDMIQNTITRMGNNSFSLKEWSVGVMVAVYAFAGGANAKAVIITIIPLIVFWTLDAYYLSQERKYRLLYEKVRTTNEKEVNFDMNSAEVLVKVKEASKCGIISSALSKTVLPFYIACVATTLIIYFVNF